MVNIFFDRSAFQQPQFSEPVDKRRIRYAKRIRHGLKPDLCIRRKDAFGIRKHKVSLYAELLTTGKLNNYLADLNEQAEAMFSRLVKQLSEKEGVTEALKAENQMLWVQRMNNIRSAAMEIVANDLIYC